MARPMNCQSISWFWDLHTRKLLDLDPPYQRRSVWNQSYKDYFIDTVLSNYPAPAIFLHQDIHPDGSTKYAVVDGKQRLSSIFDFADNQFPVPDVSSVKQFSGLYFKDLPDAIKTAFWTYQFAVEYLQITDEAFISNVFDRINRNVAKLTSQELRHARFDGPFIRQAESLTIWLQQTLPPGMPNFALQSIKQMKDLEFVAQLMLFLEDGPRSYSQLTLDQAFSDRDVEWARETETTAEFRRAIEGISEILRVGDSGQALARSRIRNQADFYSLFGTLAELAREDRLPTATEHAQRLSAFIQIVEDEHARAKNKQASDYYEAARSASNDAGPRRTRIDIIKDVLAPAPPKAGRPRR